MSDRLEVGVFTEGLPEDTYARACLEPFALGVAASGDVCRVHRGLSYEPCDVAVIFGDVRDAPAKRDRMRLKAEVKGRHMHRGLVVIDTPVLMRSCARGDDYRRVGLDGIHRDVGTFPSGLNGERWAELSRRGGLDVKDGGTRGDNIYVFLQRLCDASLRGAQRRRPSRYLSWLQRTLGEIRRHTQRAVVVRPHPASRSDPAEMEWLQEFETSSAHPSAHPGVEFDHRDRPIGEVFAEAWATVTFNSGSAIDSLLAGVPTVTCDPGSFAWPIAAHSVEGIERAELPEREPWLHALSYVDWSLDELAAGAAWQHIRPAAARVV